MVGKNWVWSPEAVERSQAKAARRRSRLATSEEYPRWTHGEVEGVLKRLHRLKVPDEQAKCLLDSLHALDGMGDTKRGELAKAILRHRNVSDEQLLEAVRQAWSVRPAHEVSGGLPTLGKKRR